MNADNYSLRRGAGGWNPHSLPESIYTGPARHPAPKVTAPLQPGARRTDVTRLAWERHVAAGVVHIVDGVMTRTHFEDAEGRFKVGKKGVVTPRVDVRPGRESHAVIALANRGHALRIRAGAAAWFFHTGEWPWVNETVGRRDGDQLNLARANLYTFVPERTRGRT